MTHCHGIQEFVQVIITVMAKVVSLRRAHAKPIGGALTVSFGRLASSFQPRGSNRSCLALGGLHIGETGVDLHQCWLTCLPARGIVTDILLVSEKRKISLYFRFAYFRN